MFAANEGVTPNDKLYVDGVFSTYLYTGNGSTQTINNGIDLAGKGGLVWIKARSGTYAGANHCLTDTVGGYDKQLFSNTTSAYGTEVNRLTSFLSSGFSLGNGSFVNGSSTDYVSWTFRKAPKFFDVVTFTTNGMGNGYFSTLLSPEIGMVIAKDINNASEWSVWHRYNSTNKLVLNTPASAINNSSWFWKDGPTSYGLSMGVANTTYVAYLFAHDISADGIIQCGSFTTDGSGNATVNLGWEPQYLLFKTSNGAGNWQILDSMRGFSQTSAMALRPNTYDAEANQGNTYNPTATGFKFVEASASTQWIYLAIRRPNKPPTSGTQVYNAIARTGTGAAATVTGVGFAPDALIGQIRGTAGYWNGLIDRLRGAAQRLVTSQTNAEDSATTAITSFGMDGVNLGSDSNGFVNESGRNYINHFFRRAPGFFDVVCWSGNGSIDRQINHSLGVVPELVIAKRRNNSGSWVVAAKVGTSFGADTYSGLFLQSTASSTTGWGEISKTTLGFTESMFNVGVMSNYSGENINGSGFNSVAYLFASLPGISKCGSYTGNGSSQTIDCGFSTGARFVLIKRTDAAGDWYVWDTARGIVAANDPHLSLNTTATEVTTNDSVDPDSSGFIVNQNTATNINVSGASYIFLAIA